MIGLTARQQECLDFLRSYHAEKGIMPSMDEIAGRFGVAKSNISRIFDRLEERGHIRRTYKKARSIELIDPAAMQAVLLSKEVFLLARAYAASQRITIDTAVSEIVREALGAA